MLMINGAKFAKPGKVIKNWIYYISTVLMCKLVLLLPRRIALGLGSALAQVVFMLSKTERRRVIENLCSSLDVNEPKQTKKVAKGCFQHLGKSVVEVMQFPKLTKKRVNQLVTFSGREHLDAALATGKGVIILTAHFGNWELLGASLTLNGYPLNVIARPLRKEQLENIIRAYREAVGMRVIYNRGAAVKQALRCLKNNEMLGILPDVDTKVGGVFVDFFGRSAYTPYGPIALAAKTQASLLPTLIIRQPDDTHRVVIEKPLKLQLTGRRDVDFIANTQLFTRVIESYIRKHPTQWIWMHPRWKTRPPAEGERRKAKGGRQRDLEEKC